MNWLLIIIIVIILIFLFRDEKVYERFTEFIGQGAQSKVGFAKNGSVKKKHRSDSGFKCEKKYLNIVKGENHVPQLLRVKENKKTIYVTWCGKPLKHDNCPPDIEKQLYELVRMMERLKIKNTDFRAGNMTVEDGIVYLVDWGMVRDLGGNDEVITAKRLASMIENLKTPPSAKRNGRNGRKGKNLGRIPVALR